MILIFSDDKAGAVLEEIGQLQREVEAGNFHSATAQDICERAGAMAEYFVARGNNNVYEPLIKPLTEWAIYAWHRSSLWMPVPTATRIVPSAMQSSNAMANTST